MSRHHVKLDRRKWARARRAALKRDNYRCQSCGVPGFECDHKTPLQRGGAPYDLDNLQCLCRSCHIAKTARERRKPDTPIQAEWRKLMQELSGKGVS